MTKITAEIYIAMNEGGDYEVGTTSEEVSERLMDQAGGEMCRIVKITLRMAPPQVMETEFDVPEETGKIQKVEIEAA